MEDERDDSSSAKSSVSQTTGTNLDKNANNAASQQSLEAEEIRRLVRKESRHVQVSRSFFLFLMLGATTVIVTLAYAVFNNQDRMELVLAFNTTALTIQGSVYYQLKEAAGAGKMVGDSLTLSALATSSPWPFVTSHNFEFYARPWLEASNAVFMSFLPLVAGGGSIESWNEYSVDNQDWINKSFQIDGEDMPSSVSSIAPAAYNLELVNGTLVQYNESGQLPVVPLWQMSPPPLDSSPVNFNGLSAEWFRTPFLSKLPSIGDGTPSLSILNLTLDTNDQSAAGSGAASTVVEPQSLMLSPVYEKPKDNSSTVAVVWSLVPWSAYLTNALPTNVSGVVAVLRSSCDEQLAYCYGIDNNRATYLGTADTHDEMYDAYEFIIPLNPSPLGGGESGEAETTPTSSKCTYAFYLYPTKSYEKPYLSEQPLTAAIWIAAVFALLIIAFLIYERFTSAKNRKLVSIAARSNKLIATLFPEGVRERLFAEEENEERKAGGTVDHLKALLRDDPLARTQGGGEFDEDDEESEVDLTSKPIADLFPEATILFADIVGFTSWSSIRQPSDVFILLETLYKAFDTIADRRRIFKVETVGDCYVAACGLPEPRKDHAVAMAKFATEALAKMQRLTKKLEVELGPDTGDLSMRFGLHSGPVTAGVLRGKRSRFQLFGDTMNTASRMETTCLRGRIQVSQATADLIVEASKGHWLVKREDVVEAKGKGRMQTYWLELKHGKSSTTDSGSTKDTSDTYSDRDDSSSNMSAWSDVNCDSNRNTRLIDWTVEVLRKLLKQVVARREAKGIASISSPRDVKITQAEGSTVLDEVAEVIALPAFDAKVARKHKESSLIFLGEDVEMQLHAYVTNIAFMYSSENAFHNFEHVAHVIMSVTKLLSRVVAPSSTTLPSKNSYSSKPFKNRNEKDVEAFMASIAHDAVGQFVVDRTSDQNRAHSNAAKLKLHDHTYGITGDPLVQFACVFSALIHDCGHTGVPNLQLCKEKPEVASNYKHKSVAEQVSVDLAWTLLQEDAYSSLRNAIYATKDEMHRFRQLVVNSVMATDIMDKDLKAQRNVRWEKAFDTDTKGRLSREQTNRRATIVIEHIIQASDVSHTMQHFDQFIHWNARLFKEMKTAYEDGRAEKDPAEFWYEGELGFFDYYVIPLAKKLKDCGVFGVTSAECLNYAMINRAEWEHRGRQVVAEYVQSFAVEQEAA